MLREVRDGALVGDGRGLLGGRRWRFESGRRVSAARWSARAVRALEKQSAVAPVLLLEDDGRRWWRYAGRFWCAAAEVGAEDLRALVAERRSRDRRRLERARAVLAQDGPGAASFATGADGADRAGYGGAGGDGAGGGAGGRAGARREPIPREIRLAVFERDGGRCVDCGATFELQFDHVIPVALGGASTAANLQVLCGPCNRRKGASVA